jgi:hypothetical protein
MPTDKTMSLVSGLTFGIRAEFESPMMFMDFLIGRDHIVALRFV